MKTTMALLVTLFVFGTINAHASSEVINSGLVTATTDLEDSADRALIQIRGEAAQSMYQVLLAAGITPSKTSRKVVVGKNLSCFYATAEEIECSFILIEGKSEPNVVDGLIGPLPGVLVHN